MVNSKSQRMIDKSVTESVGLQYMCYN